MKSALFIMLVLMGCASVAQNSSDITRIEFTSLTRGYQESLTITSDSIRFSRLKAGQPKVDKEEACTKEEWSGILKALQKVALTEIPELVSPTQKRTYDGARHSNITITTKSGQTYSHQFDDEEPHQKLMPMMKELLGKRKKYN